MSVVSTDSTNTFSSEENSNSSSCGRTSFTAQHCRPRCPPAGRFSGYLSHSHEKIDAHAAYATTRSRPEDSTRSGPEPQLTFIAKESYWNLLAWLRTQVSTPDDNEVFAAAKDRWVNAQDWTTTVTAGLSGEDLPLFLVSNYAHVGVVLGPPFTATLSLAVLDPLQIRRLQPSFTSAVNQGLREIAANAPAPAVHRATMALRFLNSQPWPMRGCVPPTRAEADHEARTRHRAFLARSPYLLPDENTPGGHKAGAPPKTP